MKKISYKEVREYLENERDNMDSDSREREILDDVLTTIAPKKRTPEDDLEALYHEAEGRFLEKANFSVIDWLDVDEGKRFQKAFKKVHGFCYDSTCGDRINCENCR